MINSIWKRRYALCLKFASFYDSDHRYDIVHDAYIYYLDKENKDLFEIELVNENSYLYTIIKRAFYRWYYKERKGPNYIYSSSELIQGGNNPLEYTIGEDLYNLFYNRLYFETKPSENTHYRTEIGRNLPMEVFRLKVRGLTQSEIAKELEISKQLVNQYSKKIKGMHTNSPFNGCKVKVTKVIKRKTLEAHPELLEKFEMGDKSDYNEYYTLMTSKTDENEGLLIREEEPKTLFM